jgi:hypothetical protein
MFSNIPQEGFYKHWNEFLGDLMLTFTEYQEVIFPCLLREGDTEALDNQITFFHSQMSPHKDLLTAKDPAIFGKGLKLAPSLSLHICWEEDLAETTKDAIWKYLQTLVFFTSLYTEAKSPDFGDVLKEMISGMAADTDLSGGSTKKKSRRTKQMERRVRDLQTLIETFSKMSESTEGEAASADAAPGTPLFDISGFKLPPDLPNIFNGTIGKLAMEIATEINAEDLGITPDVNPVDMIKKLLVKDPGAKDGMPNIVEKLTEKIRRKMAEKGISEKDLAEEAKKLIAELQSSGLTMDKIMGIFKSLGMSPNTFVPKGAKMAFNTSHNPNLARMRAQAELERRRAAASAASAADTPAASASAPPTKSTASAASAASAATSASAPPTKSAGKKKPAKK